MKRSMNALSTATLVGLMTLLAACNGVVPSNRPLSGAASEDTDTTTTTAPTDPVRPDGAVSFKSDYCGCNNTKNILVPEPTCNNFCATKNTNGEDRLYVNFTVTEAISLDPALVDTKGWCFNDVGTQVPGPCRLEAKVQVDSDTINTVNIAVKGGSGNSFFFNISDSTGIVKDKTYVLTLVEPTSGAKSNSIQIRKPSDFSSDGSLGPLKVQPISQYACILRTVNTETSSSNVTTASYYLYASLLHFYFIEAYRPDPLPAGTTNIICHNASQNGVNDSAQFDRLFEQQNAYAMWNTQDVRLQDMDSDGRPDVEKTIGTKIAAYGGTVTSTKFFAKLTNSSGPTTNSAGNSTNAGIALGWYMRYFVNTTNGNSLAVCPTATEYTGTSPAFKALGDVLQVDTEAVYLARREALTYTKTVTSGSSTTTTTYCQKDDIIITREHDMKRVWFYYKNGVPTRPPMDANGNITDAGKILIANQKMYFYYPYNFNAPTTKGADQRSYQVVDPSNTVSPNCTFEGSSSSTNPTNDTTLNSTLTAHDKRFGCIPVSNDNG